MKFWIGNEDNPLLSIVIDPVVLLTVASVLFGYEVYKLLNNPKT
jgi:hypothetical protein